MRVKLIRSVFVFFLASVFASSALAFEVYIDSRLTNQPDFAKYSIKGIGTVGGGNIFGKGSDKKLLPSKNKVTSFVKKKYGNYTGLLAIDIEQWGVQGPDAKVTSSVEKYRTVLQWVKAVTPAEVGYYGKPPVPVFSAAQKGTTHPEYLQWQAKNDKLAELAKEVDVFFPGCYPNSADPEAWVHKAVALISEAKRLGPGKEVCPFIKPRYHNRAPHGLANQLVPEDYFLRQLQTLKKHADCVVIWEGSTRPWNDQEPWWQATLTFLGKK